MIEILIKVNPYHKAGVIYLDTFSIFFCDFKMFAIHLCHLSPKTRSHGLACQERTADVF